MCPGTPQPETQRTPSHSVDLEATVGFISPFMNPLADSINLNFHFPA